jgi:hypothetical protein
MKIQLIEATQFTNHKNNKKQLLSATIQHKTMSVDKRIRKHFLCSVSWRETKQRLNQKAEKIR